MFTVYFFPLFPLAWKRLFLISLSKQTAVNQKQQKQQLPCVFFRRVKKSMVELQTCGGITVVLAITVSQLQ